MRGRAAPQEGVGARLSAELYHAFATYRHPTRLEGCPCCTSADESAELLAVPLASLPADRLDRYAFKATTTWGTLADYKYFLPRILELSRSGALLCDLEVTLGKLGYNRFADWPESEQAAVLGYLMEWAREAAELRDYVAFDSLICGISAFTDVRPFLRVADTWTAQDRETYRDQFASSKRRQLGNPFWDRESGNHAEALAWAYRDG